MRNLIRQVVKLSKRGEVAVRGRRGDDLPAVNDTEPGPLLSRARAGTHRRPLTLPSPSGRGSSNSPLPEGEVGRRPGEGGGVKSVPEGE